MYPFDTTAASFIPFEDDATSLHARWLAEVRSTHVDPESADVYTKELSATATSIDPSEDEAIAVHIRDPADVRAVQVTPEFAEV